MAGDADWVDDVRRWYLTGQQGEAGAVVSDGVSSSGEAEALGYEAADPPLQSRHWPDAPSGDATPRLSPVR